MLCKPTLDRNWQMDAQVKRTKGFGMHDNCALLGFKRMVAPVSEIARKGDPSIFNTPLPRDVQKLLGKIDVSSKMAP